jgi:hypothetical protein
VFLLGTFWCIGLAAANAVLAFRTNPFIVQSMLATLLSYPIGILLASILPKKYIGIGKFGFSLNPGPFSIKEHVLISIMGSAGSFF